MLCVFFVFVTCLYGVLGKVWHLISVPDLCFFFFYFYSGQSITVISEVISDKESGASLQ